MVSDVVGQVAMMNEDCDGSDARNDVRDVSDAVRDVATSETYGLVRNCVTGKHVVRLVKQYET